jgi:dolichol-phosphate mannosyltransferase
VSAPASLTIVVPCKDEAAAIPALAAALRASLAGAPRAIDLLLVDDGSTDATAELLERHFAGLPARILRHDRNLGLGAALATGSRAAAGDLVGWLDADLSYDPAVLLELARAIDGGAGLALASCHHQRGSVEGVGALRRCLSRAASRCYRLRTGAPIATFTSMVRVWRRDLLARCLPSRPDFLAPVESLLCALRRGARVVEVPAKLRARTAGRSKMRLLRTAAAHLRFLWRLA